MILHESIARVNISSMKKNKRRSRAGAAPDTDEQATFAGRVTPEADLTWLLNRAAQRMRVAMNQQALRHGIQLRDYLVLTALGTLEHATQLALGQALGLDKTTLTLQIDRLEERGLLVRSADPRDRRARIPQATESGRTLQAKVAAALGDVEAGLLSGFSAAEQRSLRLMLCQLIDAGETGARVAGSCL
jgi:DNA-binding MarR family transcriptional regulator